MLLSEDQCNRLLAELDYKNDARNLPDASRRGQFKAGWRNATERGRVYGPDVLIRLTWHNLGYRLGEMFGAMDGGDIDDTFESFARQFERRVRENR